MEQAFCQTRKSSIYKIIRQDAPTYMQNMIPDTVGDCHSYGTRHSRNILDVQNRTHFYSDYFLPYFFRLWNGLPDNANNSRCFQRQFKNEYLFLRNLVQSPNCSCGSIETTTHFLNFFNKYFELRNETIFEIPFPVTIDTKLLFLVRFG